MNEFKEELYAMTQILPNFLIIGAARSGTTSLYFNLLEHPDIYLHSPKRPEPHFFLRDSDYKKGLQYYSDKYFSNWNGQTAIGEASTSYIFHKRVPERIAAHLPKVKMLVVMRHPVERAFSSYWHTVKSGLETLSFDEAILREPERLVEITDPVLRENQPFAYASRSLYYKQISEYLNYFKAEQFLFLLLDDLIASPRIVIQQTFRFLGVEETFLPKSLGKTENSSTPANASMSTKTREFLLGYFREDTENLSVFLKRDLSHWFI